MANLSKSIDTRKRVSEILSVSVISEKDLNLFKSRINRGLCKYEDIDDMEGGDTALCENENGVYKFFITLFSMYYSFDLDAHIIGVEEN